ncbi:MAG TPA: TIGR04282 family arsenosugar biosynthesis glycosyltransferase [Polyangiaceae bacterium]|jgi:hypothetical protein
MGVSLGVMARAPIAGRCKTRLASALGDAAAADVYRAMLLDSLDALARARPALGRLVVMAAPEDDGVAVLRALAPEPWEILPQRGEGLGARLANAFRALGAGGDAVALVSSDSPTVSWGEVAGALARFGGERRAMMGPCDDGGYYLVALGSLELGILEGIDWSTPRVQDQTRQRCAALGLALDVLAPAYDVDDARDLERLRVELREHPGRAPRTAAVLRALP